MKTAHAEQLSNDLFASAVCDCGKSHRIVGYNDDYFFDKVNAHLQSRERECGRIIYFQWRRVYLEYSVELPI